MKGDRVSVDRDGGMITIPKRLIRREVRITMMSSDIQIREAILRELRWDTSINIEVKDGVVTLTGTVESCLPGLKAQEAAQRAEGVSKVIDEIKIKRPSGALTDLEIAEAVRHVLEWNTGVPHERIRCVVSNGWVALEGQVDFSREREDAERIVKRLAGVRGVYNEITVNQSEAQADNVRQAIEDTLKQRAELEANRIQIALKDGRVTLSGPVQSWEEERAIISAVNGAPGVQGINDCLSIAH
jgi:osmotically-inducible protein OsmY